MKILSLLVVLSLTSQCFYCQQIDFSKVGAGVTGKYLLPLGDMGEYWKSTAGAGFVLNYILPNSLSLEGELSYAKFTPQYNNSQYPDIDFLEISGGLKYNLILFRNLKLIIKPGIQNNMFIFSGPAAEFIYEQNKNESEFGFFISPGFQYDAGKGIKFELDLKLMSILSSPEPINIIIPALTVFIL